MATYRIMSFDGGGVRGALSITLLKRLQQQVPELVEKTDLFAGTSTGSFIALGLAHGLPVADIAGLYSEEKAEFIFSPKHTPLFRPKYDNLHLKKTLSSVFPAHLRLRDLKRHVLVPSFRVIASGSGGWSPVFFHNFPGSASSDIPVIDVAMASSAAPVYFPSYQGHVDGGVIANDPGAAAIAYAVDRKVGGQDMADLRLLSIGTGYTPQSVAADTSSWGGFQWLFYPSPSLPLITLLFDGVVEADTHFSSQLLGDRYFRLNPLLLPPVALDDYQKISQLTHLGEGYDLGPVMDWIHRNWL